MHGIWKAIGSFVRRADMILLSLCIAASVFGIVVISSATNVKGSAQYVRTQILALVLGIILYVFFTLVDVDIIAERRELLLIFSAIFILLLFPFGDTRSGNRSWLAFSFLPFSIQPAEICKIPFIMILAKTMSIRQNKISHISTVLRLAVITVFMFGLIVVASEDLGVALQYLFIFVIMAFVGGVSLLWFLGAFAVLLVASPFLWQFLSYDRRSRIWVLFDPRIDPAALLAVCTMAGYRNRLQLSAGTEPRLTLFLQPNEDALDAAGGLVEKLRLQQNEIQGRKSQEGGTEHEE